MANKAIQCLNLNLVLEKSHASKIEHNCRQISPAKESSNSILRRSIFREIWQAIHRQIRLSIINKQLIGLP